jgi:hypothetical protein
LRGERSHSCFRDLFGWGAFHRQLICYRDEFAMTILSLIAFARFRLEAMRTERAFLKWERRKIFVVSRYFGIAR